MTGNILTIKDYVKVLQQEGLPVILHVEKKLVVYMLMIMGWIFFD